MVKQNGTHVEKNIVSVLIPAYNESARLEATINSLWSMGKVMGQALRETMGLSLDKAKGLVGEIVVVDDGSTDETAKVAEKAGARVIRLAHNQGKGKALTVGLAGVCGQIVLLVDADLQASAGEALKLVLPVLQEQTDLAVAIFERHKAGKGFGIARKIAQLGIKHLTGVEVKAPISGQRAARKHVLESLLPFSDGFGIEVGMYIDALRQGYRVMEIPLALDHCPPGKDFSGFLHRGKQFYQICVTLKSRARGGFKNCYN